MRIRERKLLAAIGGTRHVVDDEDVKRPPYLAQAWSRSYFAALFGFVWPKSLSTFIGIFSYKQMTQGSTNLVQDRA
jgi:hypothetical protein